MKKKENLWHLLKRLDEEAGQYSLHLHKANRYFEDAENATDRILKKHERDLHKLIQKVRKPLKDLLKKKDKK